ncbi:MAG: DUF364 domain-containing protein [Acidobacteria bacterium]|nr:DUF364 domain-containing protein [Acidobacteriota bacterium]
MREGMRMLANELVDRVRERAEGRKVADVRIGLGYTAVRVDGAGCGLAYTLHEGEYESCCVVAEAGRVAGRAASELVGWMKNPDVTAAAVGLAALNALVPAPREAVDADIADVLPVRAGDAVGMVGYFGPLVGPMRERAGSLRIFERKSNPALDILPDTEAGEYLPGCDIVILTASALLNRTMDRLLELCGNAREIAVLGPSTPFVPEVFRPRGVTLLSGLEVVDPARILQIVSEGGGTRQFGRAVRKLSLRLRE